MSLVLYRNHYVEPIILIEILLILLECSSPAPPHLRKASLHVPSTISGYKCVNVHVYECFVLGEGRVCIKHRLCRVDSSASL